MRSKSLTAVFVLFSACLALAASGCGESETGGTSNSSTVTGGVGGTTAGTGGTAGGTTGGVGGTAGGVSGVGGASGMNAGSGGTGGVVGGAGGATGGSGGATGGTGGTTTGGTGGATGGTGGTTTGGTGGTMEMVDPEVAACVDAHFDGVDQYCKECMCECDTISSDCDETCWQLSACTYQHCQMGNPVNQGRDNQTQCVIDFCGIYLGSDQGSTATAVTNTGCFTTCGTQCFQWWGTPIEPGPMSIP